jgi:hypothetical protein
VGDLIGVRGAAAAFFEPWVFGWPEHAARRSVLNSIQVTMFG